MARRKTVNKTGIERLSSVDAFDAWVGFVCVNCGYQNHVRIGKTLTRPAHAYDNATWNCTKCKYAHSKNSPLPFRNWPSASTLAQSLPAQRFWQGFFRTCTEYPSSHYKQCNCCGRILPFADFSQHGEWGPLERQMECRACKGGVNAILNRLRTAQQLHEASVRRRVADLLLQGINAPPVIDELFKRFQSKCFKCGQALHQTARNTWDIDHILPSRYLYPLRVENAALLCKGCNNSKHGRWPSQFYTNGELINLSKLTGADLTRLASPAPIVNRDIDVNAGVTRYLTVRQHSNLAKRIEELKELLEEYELVDDLSAKNRQLLGFA